MAGPPTGPCDGHQLTTLAEIHRGHFCPGWPRKVSTVYLLLVCLSLNCIEANSRGGSGKIFEMRYVATPIYWKHEPSPGKDICPKLVRKMGPYGTVPCPRCDAHGTLASLF